MINFDYKRKERLGLPEAVYCKDKPLSAIKNLILDLHEREKKQPVLFTRLEPEVFRALGNDYNFLLDYHDISQTAYLNGKYPSANIGSAAVLTAGTSDASVAWEARRTLIHAGVDTEIYEDIGVAGIWRLEERISDISRHDIIIVVAGMDAALCSVVGGLTGKPVIGVPTSTGYGVADGGRSALNSMLTSCASGVSVVNIDNGYGAACAAVRIMHGR